MLWRVLTVSGVLALGCGGGKSGGSVIDAPVVSPPVVDGSVGAPGDMPRLGAHALAFHGLWAHNPELTTVPMGTSAAGSTIIASVGRGDLGAFVVPTDNKGNAPFTQLGTAHPYTRWATSGTALYASRGASGGSGYVIRTATPPDDEITLAAVEIVGATAIQAFEWNEVLAGPLKSKSVTTTGPAMLIAFWWGDGGAELDKTAVPNNGFVVVDSVLTAGSFVLASVAVKRVPAAGTYDVTWSATPVQGAQLWLVAVQ